MIEQDQNKQRTPNQCIRVCPVTQVKLWRNKSTAEKEQENGEKLEGWKLKMIVET